MLWENITGSFELPAYAGRIFDLDRFDNSFFGIPDDETNWMDHQLRSALEVVYEAVMDSGKLAIGEPLFANCSQ